MCRFSDEMLNEIWGKAVSVSGYDENKYRKDCCGAWIQRDRYCNRDSDFGWEVDHIYPECLLKNKDVDMELIDDLRNLRPMNWRNNVSKDKNYPIYRASVTSEDNKNIEKKEEYEVNKDVQEILKQLYCKYL